MPLFATKNPFFEEYLNYLQSSVQKTQFCVCKSNSLSDEFSQFTRSIITAVLKQSIDELVISNEGKQKFQHFDEIQTMIERFQQKQRTKLFDEQTLDPMYIALKRMIAVKLENDMFESFRTIISAWIMIK